MKSRQQVLGRNMAYTEEGTGNPVSSCLWRNVLPDLVGMGQSDKLADSGPGAYRFATHYCYLSALLKDANFYLTEDQGEEVARRIADFAS